METNAVLLSHFIFISILQCPPFLMEKSLLCDEIVSFLRSVGKLRKWERFTEEIVLLHHYWDEDLFPSGLLMRHYKTRI